MIISAPVQRVDDPDLRRFVTAVYGLVAMKTGKGQATRNRILEIVEESVLAKGFGATTIDEVIAEAGITKSGFFYHFRDKNELARILLQRYMERDDILLDEVFERGKKIASDPLQGFLAGLEILADTMAELPNGHPGCLVATYAYQEQLFDRQVRQLYQDIILHWRARFRALLAEIHRSYQPRDDIDLDALADMVSTVIEGGLVLGKAAADPAILPAQLRLLGSYIRLLFDEPRRNEAIEVS